MATLDGRHGRALLVIDLQQGVLEGAHQHDDVIRTVTEVVSRAHAAAVPVAWANGGVALGTRSCVAAAPASVP